MATSESSMVEEVTRVQVTRGVAPPLGQGVQHGSVLVRVLGVGGQRVSVLVRVLGGKGVRDSVFLILVSGLSNSGLGFFEDVGDPKVSGPGRSELFYGGVSFGEGLLDFDRGDGGGEDEGLEHWSVFFEKFYNYKLLLVLD